MENKVLAVVNGNEITEKDVQMLLNSLGPQRAQQFNNEQGKKALVNELVNQALFLEDAKEKNIQETDAFKAELALVKENIMKQMNINNLLAEIKVSDEEAKEFYEKNKTKYITEEQVKASHILVDSEDKIKEIAKEIEAGDINFEEAAKKYSKCPSKTKGGNLGQFTRGKMVPEFEKVAFELKKDEISEPVKTQFGFHLVKTTDKIEKDQKSFEDSKQQIIQQLTSSKQKEVYQDKIEELKGKYTVDMK